MATDTKLDSLVINYLTQSQYDDAKSAGTLNSNQIYMTPATTYELPTASTNTLGGVKIGSNITVSSGTISLTKTNITNALGYIPPTTDTQYTLPTATSSTLGGVKLSDSTTSTSDTTKGIAATPAAVNAAIEEAKLAAWPIGSIYMSVNSTSPANLFGGTWTQIQERFLLAASSSYAAGSTGGEFTHKLTQSELPNYSLTVTNGSDLVHSKNGSTAAAYVQTQSSGWGIPNWDAKTVTVASGGSGQAHNNMPPYLAVWMWKRTA